MKLFLLGDSITEGYGVMPENCYASLLSEKFEVVNYGCCGMLSDGMLVRAEHVINHAQQGDICIVMGGANDVLVYGDRNEAAANIRAICEKLLAAGITPILAGEPGFAVSEDPFYDRSYLDVYYKVSMELAIELIKLSYELNIKLIDLSKLFSDSNGLTKSNLFLDGVHPTSAGHVIIAQAIEAELSNSN